ncbi:MAG: tyrosine-protein phosphatase [Oscillospiraceae bacterium]|nr:tyrosine-protein phosphatase [Oscillospiraceae bacterium]
MIYRKYPMKGTENTRDLGGYPTKDGGVTKFGVFVRSDAWDKATEEDIAFIKNLGIRTVVDLRTKEQAEKNPHPLSRERGFDYHNVPVMGGGKIPDTKEEFPITYMQMADGTEYMRDVFRAFACCEPGFLFNCVAGKDRTGVVAGLLLEICGVSEADIYADYLLSASYLYDNIYHDAPIYHFDPEVITPNRENWAVFTKMFREKYGSAHEYLNTIGITENEIGSIVSKLVEK